MDYQVSPKVQKLFDEVISLPEVQRAVDFIEKDLENSIEEQIALTLIESPTFNEEKRSHAYAEYFKSLGLENVHVDDFGNTVGLWRGAGKGPKVLVEAHLDTVFPFGSVKEVKRENGVLYAPGICDDTRGLAILLAALRGLKETGFQTKGDIVFVGTSREEGMGSLGGMKDFLDHNPDIDASISVDGGWVEEITYEATGFKTYEVNFYGIGGHAYGAFGKMANPLHAAARAVAKIADFQVPEDPKTTFCVSNFHAGNDAGVHAIVPKATIKLNFRSNSAEILEELNDRVFKAIQEACDEETARWGKDTITWDCKQYCDVPAGNQDVHAPLVEATYLTAAHLVGSEKVKFGHGGSVNGNMAVARGLQCVTIGGGPYDVKCHNLEEFFPIEGAYKCPQEVMILLLLASGIEGKTESILQ
ncbi:MAG: M20/M25/M40 family metallo-hydrolase [Clostridiaceae bacterium]|nr:M20/M25/M40 family metallo-hydrolase [Clostridiaceae bacterium]